MSGSARSPRLRAARRCARRRFGEARRLGRVRAEPQQHEAAPEQIEGRAALARARHAARACPAAPTARIRASRPAAASCRRARRSATARSNSRARRFSVIDRRAHFAGAPNRRRESLAQRVAARRVRVDLGPARQIDEHARTRRSRRAHCRAPRACARSRRRRAAARRPSPAAPPRASSRDRPHRRGRYAGRARRSANSGARRRRR